MSRKYASAMEIQMAEQRVPGFDGRPEPESAPQVQLNSLWHRYYAPLTQANQLQLLVQFDSAPQETKESFFLQNRDEIVSVVVTLLYRISKDDVLYYALQWMDEINGFLENLYKQIQAYLPENISSPFQLFYRLLRRSHEPSVRTAAFILAKLLVANPSEPHAQDHLTLYVAWVNETITEGTVNIRLPIECLMILLKHRPNRLYTAKQGTLQLIAELTKKNIRPIKDIQLMYESIFCVWLMSYDPQVAAMDFLKDSSELVAVLVDVLRVAEKEKVLRMSLAALRNLSANTKHIETMLAYGILKILDSFSKKTWGDEDIEEDIRTLREKIHAEKHVLSSFDHYQEEILSGQLQWSPVHTSEIFWRENIKRFEEREFHLLRVLIQLLRTSESPQVLAVACHDLGEFVCYHPRGKSIVQELQAKALVMGLMVHSHIEVQKQALLCTQKLMVKNWEFLTGGPSAAGK